eukprot:TRINITY_DN915_c0_g1_i1.p1 TRINITY_DN915_c0_g1~~TRINITY_DN915_c0_g1_i1.p1  ORF type:complete len:557 (-),score=87.80 TRINITY_DN915_c0_g1_i1:107-1777(-)
MARHPLGSLSCALLEFFIACAAFTGKHNNRNPFHYTANVNGLSFGLLCCASSLAKCIFVQVKVPTSLWWSVIIFAASISILFGIITYAATSGKEIDKVGWLWVFCALVSFIEVLAAYYAYSEMSHPPAAKEVSAETEPLVKGDADNAAPVSGPGYGAAGAAKAPPFGGLPGPMHPAVRYVDGPPGPMMHAPGPGPMMHAAGPGPWQPGMRPPGPPMMGPPMMGPPISSAPAFGTGAAVDVSMVSLQRPAAGAPQPPIFGPPSTGIGAVPQPQLSPLPGPGPPWSLSPPPGPGPPRSLSPQAVAPQAPRSQSPLPGAPPVPSKVPLSSGMPPLSGVLPSPPVTQAQAPMRTPESVVPELRQGQLGPDVVPALRTQASTKSILEMPGAPPGKSQIFDELGSPPAPVPLGATSTAPPPTMTPFGGPPAPVPLGTAPAPKADSFGAPSAPTGSLGGPPAPVPLGTAPVPQTEPFGGPPAPVPLGTAPPPTMTSFGGPPARVPLGTSPPAFAGPPAPVPLGTAPAPTAATLGAAPAPAPTTSSFGRHSNDVADLPDWSRGQ